MSTKEQERCESLERNGKAHRRCTRQKHEGDGHTFGGWSLTEPAKKTPRHAYVAVIDLNGKHKLGIAEKGEPGYCPIDEGSDLGGEYQSRKHALTTAEEANKRLGLTYEEASAIVASSIGASMRRP